MNEMRGQWDVPTGSFHWKLYQRWRALGGKGPLSHERPIDLCHYMRVVCLWVWCRKFFFGRFLPWLWPIAAAAIGTVIYLSMTWPGVALNVVLIFSIIGICLGFLGLFIYYTGSWWESKHPSKGYFRAIGRFLARPFKAFGHGVAYISRGAWMRISNRVQRSVRWFFLRPIYWRITPAAVFALLLLIVPFYFSWQATLFTLGLVGVALLVVGVIFGCVYSLVEYGLPWWRERRLRKQARKAKGYIRLSPAESKPPSQIKMGLRLLWQWLVAHKHRICPLITPVDSSGS